MSETYRLICDQCRVGVWVGEETDEHGPGKRRLMLYDAYAFGAAEMLYKHLGHPLRCVAEPIVSDDYVELDNKTGLALVD